MTCGGGEVPGCNIDPKQHHIACLGVGKNMAMIRVTQASMLPPPAVRMLAATTLKLTFVGSERVYIWPFRADGLPVNECG
jgi:hypothetical protein